MVALDVIHSVKAVPLSWPAVGGVEVGRLSDGTFGVWGPRAKLREASIRRDTRRKSFIVLHRKAKICKKHWKER